jgi:hypothetical protein
MRFDSPAPIPLVHWAVKDNRELPATAKFLRGWVWAADRNEMIAKAMERWPDLDPTQIRS